MICHLKSYLVSFKFYSYKTFGKLYIRFDNMNHMALHMLSEHVMGCENEHVPNKARTVFFFHSVVCFFLSFLHLNKIIYVRQLSSRIFKSVINNVEKTIQSNHHNFCHMPLSFKQDALDKFFMSMF